MMVIVLAFWVLSLLALQVFLVLGAYYQNVSYYDATIASAFVFAISAIYVHYHPKELEKVFESKGTRHPNKYIGPDEMIGIDPD